MWTPIPSNPKNNPAASASFYHSEAIIMIPIKERLESDVLIVGGGIAGLMAAIAAADKGASVTLLD